ncbi:MAG: hypothetical protein ACTSRG_11295 [Candidatus Helarchaeota archaeon]
MPFHYSDIPDDVYTKNFLPLLHNLWKSFEELGWEYYSRAFEIFSRDLYKIAVNRINDSIKTAKGVVGGEYEHPEKILAYTIFPPVVSIRQDLQIGTGKLLYGDSVDTTFLIVDDDKNELAFIWNAHAEEGVPVDWWYCNAEDEVLDRRHLKLGFKLRDFPKKIKRFNDIGMRAIEVLKDIRNERTPQWKDSLYYTCVVWYTGFIDQVGYISNFESLGAIWDGLAAKNLGVPDQFYAYCPWPPMMKNFVLGGRSEFILAMAGLCTQHKLYCQGDSMGNHLWYKENFPEWLYIFYRQSWEETGVQRPAESLTAEFPYLKEKKDTPKKYTTKTRKQKRIFCKDLDLEWDVASRCVYLNVTHNTPEDEPIDASKIISIGIGESTEVIN